MPDRDAAGPDPDGSPDRATLDSLLDDRESAPSGSRRGLRRWLIVLGCLLAALIVAAGAVTVSGIQVLNSVQREPGMLPTGRPVPVQDEPGPVNFLLLGADARGAERGRSDVMILAHADPRVGKVYLISLPRDLWVEIPGHGRNKINAAYAFGGAPLAVETVQNLLGVRIDHVARTDFDGFFKLIDDLGGVTVFNEIPSASGGFTFPRGEVNLTGAEALAYVRERYALPRGDFDRAERQRLVIAAMVDKLASGQTFANPARLLAVINRLSAEVTVDDSLTNQRIVGLAGDLQLTSGDDVEQLQVPVSGFGTSAAGASYVKPDAAGIKRLGAALRAGRMDAYRP